jgi:hypothetical protein
MFISVPASAGWRQQRQRRMHTKSPWTHLHAIDHGGPVTEDKALEVKLLLQDTDEEFAVLACLCLVDLVVGAPWVTCQQVSCAASSCLHNTSGTGLDTLGEWPAVDFVERAVVDVGAVDLAGL